MSPQPPDGPLPPLWSRPHPMCWSVSPASVSCQLCVSLSSSACIRAVSAAQKSFLTPASGDRDSPWPGRRWRCPPHVSRSGSPGIRSDHDRPGTPAPQCSWGLGRVCRAASSEPCHRSPGVSSPDDWKSRSNFKHKMQRSRYNTVFPLGSRHLLEQTRTPRQDFLRMLTLWLFVFLMAQPLE